MLLRPCMFRAPVMVLVIALAVIGQLACHARDPEIQCTSSAVCDRFEDGECRLYEPTGKYWCAYFDLSCESQWRWSDLDVGDGLEGECVAVADGGSTTDAAADALVIDALPDGTLPTVPPVVNYQSANLVLGQPDYVSSTSNNGGRSAISAYEPADIEVAGGRFFFADGYNARILGYDLPPVNIQQAADFVIGQADFTSRELIVTQDRLSGASGICSDGTRLIATDNPQNRVLVWTTIPETNGEPADLVLGQANFTSGEEGKTAGKLYGPTECWTDGTRLLVADALNHRVLIWNTFPTVNQQPASIVLGWPDFGYGAGDAVVNPPTSSSMLNPRDVFFDGERLYVADSSNHRVMVWIGMPATNGEAADYVVGQDDMTANAPDRGLGFPHAEGLSTPTGVESAFGSLFVVDRNNSRVLVYSPIPTSSGATADAVLGKLDLEAVSGSLPASQRNLHSPWGLSVIGETLWVADRLHHRVLRYGLSP
jgi:hypothetical protein